MPAHQFRQANLCVQKLGINSIPSVLARAGLRKLTPPEGRQAAGLSAPGPPFREGSEVRRRSSFSVFNYLARGSFPPRFGRDDDRLPIAHRPDLLKMAPASSGYSERLCSMSSFLAAEISCQEDDQGEDCFFLPPIRHGNGQLGKSSWPFLHCRHNG
jgi:hypothetical protein